jgi:hypothetical protein
LGRDLSLVDPELMSLAISLARMAFKSRSPRTMAQYRGPWDKFTAWCEAQRPGGSPYDVPPQMIAMYLTLVLQSAMEDSVGPGRVMEASAAIHRHFALVGRASPTNHPSCQLVRDIAQRVLKPERRVRDSMRPEWLLALAERFATVGAALPDLMMVTVAAIMFAGFLRFDDATEISVHHDLLVLFPSHMEVFIPKSKSDQRMEGAWIVIAHTGGAACPVCLTERLLEVGGCQRIPVHPQQDVGPLLRRVKTTKDGYRLQALTGTVSEPIPSLAYSSFKEKLERMCAAAGIAASIKPHSFRLGGNSTAAANGVPEEVRKAHGRWRSDAMVQHYTRRDLGNALEVTRKIGLS